METPMRLVPSTSTTAPDTNVGNTTLSFSAKAKKMPQHMSVPAKHAPMKLPKPYSGAMSKAGDTKTMLHTIAMGTFPPTGPMPSV